VARGEAAVGVPETTPVAGARERPLGRLGVTEYRVTVPVTEGTSGDTGRPTVPLSLAVA